MTSQDGPQLTGLDLVTVCSGTRPSGELPNGTMQNGVQHFTADVPPTPLHGQHAPVPQPGSLFGFSSSAVGGAGVATAYPSHVAQQGVSGLAGGAVPSMHIPQADGGFGAAAGSLFGSAASGFGASTSGQHAPAQHLTAGNVAAAYSGSALQPGSAFAAGLPGAASALQPSAQYGVGGSAGDISSLLASLGGAAAAPALPVSALGGSGALSAAGFGSHAGLSAAALSGSFGSGLPATQLPPNAVRQLATCMG